MRHLVYHFLNEISSEIRDKIYIEYNDDANEMTFRKIKGKEEKEKRITEEDFEGEREVRIEKGFKSLFDEILKSKKPIIGFDCFLHVLFIYNHLINDLPLNYKEFKIKYLDWFKGGIYDIKQMTLNMETVDLNMDLKMIKLEDIYENLKGKVKDVNVIIPKTFKEDQETGGLNNISEISHRLSGLTLSSNDVKTSSLCDKIYEIGSAFLFIQHMEDEGFLKENKNIFNCADLRLYDRINLGGLDKFKNSVENVYEIKINISESSKRSNQEQELDKIYDILNDTKYSLKIYERRTQELLQIMVLSNIEFTLFKKLFDEIELDLDFNEVNHE